MGKKKPKRRKLKEQFARQNAKMKRLAKIQLKAVRKFHKAQLAYHKAGQALEIEKENGKEKESKT